MPITRVDLRVLKRELRDKQREYRRSLSSEEKNRLDEKIFRKLTNLWIYRNAELLLAYVSGTIEVDTLRLIDDALRHGKRVAVPRCAQGTERDMDFYFINSRDELLPGSYGILEPPPDEGRLLSTSDARDGLCIVPALTFDTEGYRLGFGKGYYDRFLSSFSGKTAGICYSACIEQQLPHGKYDKKVDMLITENRLYSIT